MRSSVFSLLFKAGHDLSEDETRKKLIDPVLQEPWLATWLRA